MTTEDFIKLLNNIKDYFSFENFNIEVFATNIVVSLIIFLVYYNLNIRDFIKNKKQVILFVINILFNGLSQLVLGNIIIIYPLFIFFLIQFALILKDKDFLNYFSNTENTYIKDKKQANIDYKLQRLGKNKDFNILDILYIYDYITDYQRRKVIQNMITESIDSMAEKLLTTYTISRDELQEAKVILNLIELQGKLVSKEDALLYLIKYRELHPEENNNDNVSY